MKPEPSQSVARRARLAGLFRGWRPEPELAGPPPRSVPAELRRGPGVRGRRKYAAVMVAWAILLHLASQAAAVSGADRVVGFLVLSAQTAYVVTLLAAYGVLIALRTHPELRFVRDGIVEPVLVRSVKFSPQVPPLPGAPATTVELAAVCERIAGPGEPDLLECIEGQYHQLHLAGVTSPVQAGEVVTLVRLPGPDFGKFQIYRFLELHKPFELAERLLAVLVILPMYAGLMVLAGVGFACCPELVPPDLLFSWVYAPATLLGGTVGTVVGRFLQDRTSRAWLPMLSGAAYGAVAGAILLGCSVVSANRLMDRGPSKTFPARLQSAQIETIAKASVVYGILRLAFEGLPEDEAASYRTTREFALKFAAENEGKPLDVSIRPGLFGLPWIAEVRPRPVPTDPATKRG